MILWGAIWLLANSVSDLAPAQSGTIWLVLTLFGVIGSGWLAWRLQAAIAAHAAPGRRPGQGWRWMVCFLVILAFQVAAIAVLQPADGRTAGHVFVDVLDVPFIWRFGAWTGWRLFAIGLTATVLILFGYYGVHSHYFLYMGCVSGGALMGGGLWLRHL